jgi:Protein of unknown function (DUF1194)
VGTKGFVVGRSLVFFFCLFLFQSTFAKGPYVDTLLVIAVDVSGSIDDNEYKIQKDGIADAFSDPSVQELLRQCSTSGIGITYMEWSGHSQSYLPQSVNPFVQVIPWTQLLTPEDMNVFANQLRSSSRSSNGETDIARSLAFAGKLFLSSPFESDNLVVSLSTDGQQGRTIPGVSTEDFVKMERDKLASLGVTINAIGIEPSAQAGAQGTSVMPTTKGKSMEVYLNENVRAGSNSFVIPAADFKAYSEAFKKQLYVMMNACIS